MDAALQYKRWIDGGCQGTVLVIDQGVARAHQAFSALITHLWLLIGNQARQKAREEAASSTSPRGPELSLRARFAKDPASFLGPSLTMLRLFSDHAILAKQRPALFLPARQSYIPAQQLLNASCLRFLSAQV
ncbi:hypothetical protein OC842_007492, partial [Tilletia horrida]